MNPKKHGELILRENEACMENSGAVAFHLAQKASGLKRPDKQTTTAFIELYPDSGGSEIQPIGSGNHYHLSSLHASGS